MAPIRTRVTRTSTMHQTVTEHISAPTATDTQAVRRPQLVRANAVANLMNQYPSVHGYLYPMNGVRTRPKPCRLNPRTGTNLSPDLGVNQIFNRPPGPGIRLHPDLFRATVIIGNSKYLVYGYDNRGGTAVVNESIRAIRPTSPWYGEVFILEVGKRGCFLIRPRINKPLLDTIATLFVSRITEARDMGRALPTQIVVFPLPHTDPAVADQTEHYVYIPNRYDKNQIFGHVENFSLSVSRTNARTPATAESSGFGNTAPVTAQ
ncbi:hypothetical protein BD779DRAFT_1473913 [Infundibulicybe gibba]|nr:hypothetical protein BD779DRAFT_1477836 [Infundibulicybe gibba]KAF8880276.1 hypothetical protein BD779DRAFT_1473913 [Infundibulicybe gibba]